MIYKLLFSLMESNFDIEEESFRVIEASDINEVYEEAEKIEASFKEKGWDCANLEAIYDSEDNLIEEA